jgi:hypothetical protein
MIEVTSERSWRRGAGYATGGRISGLQSCFHEVQWISYDDTNRTTGIASPEVSGHGFAGTKKETRDEVVHMEGW